MLGRALDRLTAPDSTTDDAETDIDAAPMGCDLIADKPNRQLASLHGTLRSVTLRPRGGAPALEAELCDRSGSVIVIWLGRRRIEGIEPGRRLTVHGRLGARDGERILFNPRYELSA